MKVLSCPRIDCPLERTRETMAKMRAEREAAGAKFSAETQHIASCDACSMTRGWKRNSAGEEREIDQDVIWGRHKGSDAA